MGRDKLIDVLREAIIDGASAAYVDAEFGDDEVYIDGPIDLGVVADRLQAPERPGPEIIALAKAIYESLPSEDDSDPTPWESATGDERLPFYINAQNLAHVFPEQYPKVVAEMEAGLVVHQAVREELNRE